ncbi:S24 family peptidase [Nocardioides sp. GCM10027113]|uniref:S24 family peptidase n=1 Tax=unclassified Nocardioides TaxID=2615069 RepID=UPI0036219F09
MPHPPPAGSSYPSGARPHGPVGLARVTGDSMRPTLAPGDRLLVRYAAPVREDALVLARFVDGTLAVKRAVERRPTRTGAPAWWLVSDDPDRGVDSRHRGPVPDADVLAVVLARVWPRPRLL